MKLDKKKNIQRLVIFFFYDADGIVDRYVPYMLEDVKRNCSELFVIVNGKLTKEGRDTFLKLTPKLMVRENKGFDVWAYKTALEHYGWDKLAEYDEVIMMNHTIMGPVYPFSEMFEEMNKRDLDFWGITKHHRLNENVFNLECGYVPEHIQSHFIAIRQPMLKSPELKQYWDDRPEIDNYNDAVAKHEAIFTGTFEDKGFVSGVYVDTSDLEELTEYPLMKIPVRLLSEYRCPIFKRRAFFNDYFEVLREGDGSASRELLAYLKKETSYDTDLIWEAILRSCNMQDIRLNLNLNYVLSANIARDTCTKRKIALVMHIYYEDLLEYCWKYAVNMPSGCDVYITVPSEKVKRAAEKLFWQNGPWKNVKVIVIENRGRDVSALLVGAAPYVMQYDYVCFMHDKKVKQLQFGVTGYAFSERLYQNLLGTKELVQNILSLFESEQHLGLLFPPPPNHAEYFGNMGSSWGPNFEKTKELYDDLELTVPISQSKEPVAPLGTMFWFRPKALEKLFERKWEYEDFPKEPNKNDGTMLHAVERIYPFVAQEATYYSAWILSDAYAQMELTNLEFMLRSVVSLDFALYGNNYLWGLVATLYNEVISPGNQKRMKRIRIKNKIKEHTPKWIWAVFKKTYHLFGGKKWVG